MSTDNPTTITPLAHLSQLITAFEAVQQKYRAFGAADTEPDGIFQGLIIKAAEGKLPAPPARAWAWELYASSMNCDEAAKALEQAARAVIELIENMPIRHTAALQQKIDNYCWRFR